MSKEDIDKIKNLFYALYEVEDELSHNIVTDRDLEDQLGMDDKTFAEYLDFIESLKLSKTLLEESIEELCK